MKHAFVRFAVAASVLLALGLVVMGVFSFGPVGAAPGCRERAATEAFLAPGGGKIALPGDVVVLLVPKGAVERPVRIRVEKVRPEDLPGPMELDELS
ncbi:hypothetical protein [Oceanithermus desulfurans]